MTIIIWVSGGCMCGAIRYTMPANDAHQTLCHCSDCRRSAGAPAVAWTMVRRDQLTVTGKPQQFESSEHGRRYFCPKCGTGLFYTNASAFPDMIDVQTATLDNPNAIPLGGQIQIAERLHYMANLDNVPAHQRYPSTE